MGTGNRILAAFACATMLFGATARAQDLALVKDGKPACVVVVPEDKPPLAMAAAAMLTDKIAEATGARLQTVVESQAPAGTKVFVGRTQAAEKAGLQVDRMTGLQCALKVADGNLFLAGNDRSNFIQGKPYIGMPASKKAVHILLRDYAGVRWLWPNSRGLGTEVPKTKALSVPATLNRTWTPSFDWVAAAFRQREGFEFNSDYAGSVPYYSYGGHSYYAAVPKEKYAKDHPEYFALLSGVRNSSANHLCISNPAVQEMIYQEMVKHVDEGYPMVQLAQTDGYQACQCEACRAIHSDIGEQLWIVHNRLAQRLAKDRPNAKAVILAYGPTYHPPKTIPRFGPNVVIELCSYGHENFAEWRGKADAFMVYVYNWGSYHTMGFGPKTTPRMIAQQVKFFRDQKVRGIYCCGMGEAWGLEGPVYYIFNRVLEDPDCDWKAELDGFYRAAFGKAYVPMKQLFDALYDRLEPLGAHPNWTPTLPGFRAPTIPGNPETQYSYFYPPSLIKYMESKLQRAKELEPEGAIRARIDLVERNFTYCADIATVFHLYHAYQILPSWTTFDPLADAIKRRNDRVREFFAKGNGTAEYDGFPSMFPHQNVEFALAGGRMSGRLSAPINWDVDGLRAKKVLPGVGRKTITVARAAAPVKLDGKLDDEVWQRAEAGEFVEIGMGRLMEPTTIRLAYDDRNFYVAFECAETLIDRLKANWRAFGPDGALYGQDCVEVFIDPAGDLSKWYHFICSALPNSYYDEAFGLHDDPLHPLYNRADKDWNGTWSYAGDIDAAGKKWTVEIAVPFATLGVAPATAGSIWKMNLGRERFIHGEHVDPELSLWSPNLERRSFGSVEAFGDVVFK